MGGIGHVICRFNLVALYKRALQDRLHDGTLGRNIRWRNHVFLLSSPTFDIAELLSCK
jgi:hypothetical protein